MRNLIFGVCSTQSTNSIGSASPRSITQCYQFQRGAGNGTHLVSDFNLLTSQGRFPCCFGPPCVRSRYRPASLFLTTFTPGKK